MLSTVIHSYLNYWIELSAVAVGGVVIGVEVGVVVVGSGRKCGSRK